MIATVWSGWLHGGYNWIKFHFEVLTIIVALLNAVATLAAVAVALFLQYLRERWGEPKLTIKLRQRDCTSDDDLGDGTFASYQYRLHIINTGSRSAEGVEATVVDVYRRDYRGTYYRIIREFLPTPLRWTHSPSSIRVFVPGNAARLLDLGVFNRYRFRFDTEIEPKTGYNVLSDGAYVVRVIVSARNARSAEILLRLGIGNLTHHDHPDRSSSADAAPFSLVTADKSVKKLLDDHDNLFDDELPNLRQEESRARDEGSD